MADEGDRARTSAEAAERLLAETTAAQLKASDPTASAWVDANAGAGKTHVLKMRVLRLLLGGVAPERILCLTYTKAAAAEMAGRVFRELAQWSTISDAALDAELVQLLDRAPTPDERIAARQLFAKAIETPGGLKVQTIHAFCERLLQRFPLEAQVPPGFEILDETTTRALMRGAIDRALGEANAAPDSALGEAVAHAIAYAANEQFDAVLDKALGRRAWLKAMADGVATHGADFDADAVKRAYQKVFGLSHGDTIASVEMAMGDVLDQGQCLFAAERLAQSDKKMDNGVAEKLAAAAKAESPAKRADLFRQTFMTSAGEPRAEKFITKYVYDNEPVVAELLSDAKFRFAELNDRAHRCRIVEATVSLLTIAQRVMRHYSAAKAQRAALDFDDLIQRAASLLDQAGAAAWVLYKLDGGLDHVLVDEAQDTSPVQWRVIDQLVAEFFAGEGAYEDARAGSEEPGQRTIFAVGDEKQSIYSFQGAAPEMFESAGRDFKARAAAAERAFHTVPLTLSFRTVSPLLDAVDRVFADPNQTPGLTSSAKVVRHLVLRQGHAGLFELWDAEVPEEVAPAAAFEPLEEVAASSPVRRVAERIATQVEGWLARGERLVSQNRPIRAGDILVLVRKREPFAIEMVRAFKRRGIAVAGADRIVLGEHIAVQDLMAVADFLLLPEDDLALANVLKSPLFGLDDDDLMVVAPARPGLLWTELLRVAETNERFAHAGAQLKRWRAQADFSPPFEFFANLLDRDGGRARLIGRLGADAGDAIDEFMNLALNYDEQAPPSLQGFVTWLRDGRREIKRDMEHGRDEVRVMTVHGSKGLEAPIVFLPDTCSGLGPNHSDDLATLNSDALGAGGTKGHAWVVKGTSKTAVIADARQGEKARALAEHNRLLYVAMTRARDRLYVGGFTGKKGPAEGSWYDSIEAGLAGYLDEIHDDAGRRLRRLESRQNVAAKDGGRDVEAHIAPAPLPDWARRPAPREANLTVPLAPSRIEPAATDDDGEWPALDELRNELRPPLEPAIASPIVLQRDQSLLRGTLTHALLEHLPEIDAAERDCAARQFLAARGQSLPHTVLDDIRRKVLGVLEDAAFAHAFGPASRAEVGIAATVPAPDGKGPTLKVNGQIDRLVRTETGILIVDYKSNRRPPQRPEDAPLAYLLQLAAYRKVLTQIYAPSGLSGDDIEAAFLWTDVAALMPVPNDLLDGVQTRLWEVSF